MPAAQIRPLEAQMAQAIETGERRDLRLTTPIPIAWTYLTAYATEDGVVHFRDDVYGWDK
jgi:L,D-transpeptidase YcbB